MKEMQTCACRGMEKREKRKKPKLGCIEKLVCVLVPRCDVFFEKQFGGI